VSSIWIAFPAGEIDAPKPLPFYYTNSLLGG